MDQFTLDCRQLDRWDAVKQPPVPLPIGFSRRNLQPLEVAAMRTTLRFGKLVNPALGTGEELLGLASSSVVAKILPPSMMPVGPPPLPALALSKSTALTEAVAFVVSGNDLLFGGFASAGIFTSTTREVGIFTSGGGGLFFNSAGASIGGELTIILGTPADFAGPFLGVSVGAGEPLAVTATVLFSPKPPLTLVLMGVAMNISATTPTKLPVTVSIVVSNTEIIAITRI